MVAQHRVPRRGISVTPRVSAPVRLASLLLADRFAKCHCTVKEAPAAHSKEAPVQSLTCVRGAGAQMAVRDALNSAIDDEMAADERVFLIGEEVGEYQGAYKVRACGCPRHRWFSPRVLPKPC